MASRNGECNPQDVDHELDEGVDYELDEGVDARIIIWRR